MGLEHVDHVVVLMFENRSFDYMLGWLYQPEEAPGFEGVAGRELSNPVPEWLPGDRRSVPVGRNPGDARAMTWPNPDPGEEWARVNTQVFGTILPEANRRPPYDRPPRNLPDPLPPVPPMTGFVADYARGLEADLGRQPTYPEIGQVMECFGPESVPVLSSLARSYAVCDRWHAPVPSETFCNRAFAAAGTSGGFVLNSPFHHWLFNRWETLYDRLQQAGLEWALYYDALDVAPATALLHPTLWHYRRDGRFRTMGRFHQDCREGALPCYSFVEPRLWVDHSDMHPPVSASVVASSVLAGEALLQDVYESLRDSPAWERTLLVVVFDEHGGCFDHVPPPEAVPPDAGAPAGEMGFRFDRLGVRVPAVLVSPWIEPGTVLSTVFDHTSILRTVCQRWGLPHLGERDRRASSLAEALSRSRPRTDRPPVASRTYDPAGDSAGEPLTGWHRALLALWAGLALADRVVEPGSLVEKGRALAELVRTEVSLVGIHTVGQAAALIQRLEAEVG